jgi:hypothetical protein
MFSQSFCPVDQVKPTLGNDQKARSVGEACGFPGEIEAVRRESPVLVFPTHELPVRINFGKIMQET